MARAVGFIEAEGFVPVFDAVDAMVKATEVEVRGAVRLGGGLVAVAVTGDLATVEEAVEIGEETARAVSGRAVKSIVFASPCLPVRRSRATRRWWGADGPKGAGAIGILETRGMVGAHGGDRGDDEDRRRRERGRRPGVQRLPRGRRPRLARRGAPGRERRVRRRRAVRRAARGPGVPASPTGSRSALLENGSADRLRGRSVRRSSPP